MLRAARAPQDRRAAPRPPLVPHCIQGKKLRGDIPLLPALPAQPGCHRDIASPLHGARLSRPTYPPTATDRQSERTTDRPLPPRAGQKQAFTRPGPTPLNGRFQLPDLKLGQPLGTLPAAQSYLPLLLAAVPVRHFSAGRTLLSPCVHWSRPLPAPPLLSTRIPESGWRSSAVWAGPVPGAGGGRSQLEGS